MRLRHQSPQGSYKRILLRKDGGAPLYIQLVAGRPLVAQRLLAVEGLRSVGLGRVESRGRLVGGVRGHVAILGALIQGHLQRAVTAEAAAGEGAV